MGHIFSSKLLKQGKGDREILLTCNTHCNWAFEQRTMIKHRAERWNHVHPYTSKNHVNPGYPQIVISSATKNCTPAMIDNPGVSIDPLLTSMISFPPWCWRASLDETCLLIEDRHPGVAPGHWIWTCGVTPSDNRCALQALQQWLLYDVWLFAQHRTHRPPRTREDTVLPPGWWKPPDGSDAFPHTPSASVVLDTSVWRPESARQEVSPLRRFGCLEHAEKCLSYAFLFHVVPFWIRTWSTFHGQVWLLKGMYGYVLGVPRESPLKVILLGALHGSNGC